MSLSIQWQSSPRLTAIYALRYLVNYSNWADSRLAMALHDSPNLAEHAGKPETWLALQSGVAAEDESLLDSIEQRIRDCEIGIKSIQGQIDQELRLRQEPLKQLWEAHGPGLLLATLRSANLVPPERVSIVTVLPLHGGGGEAIHDHQTIVFENVLANPIAEVPETLRLAWLISQLASTANADNLLTHCIQAALEIGIIHQDVEEIARRTWQAH